MAMPAALKNASKKHVAEVALKVGTALGAKMAASKMAQAQGGAPAPQGGAPAPQGAPMPPPQAPAPGMQPPQPAMKKGGKVKSKARSFAKGGGVESKGKTKGRYI